MNETGMPESFWYVEDCTTGFPIIKTSWGTLWNMPLECPTSLCLQFLSVSWKNTGKEFVHDMAASFVWWFASLIWGRGPPPLEIYIDEHNPFEIACSTDLISPQDSSYTQNSNSPKIAIFQHLTYKHCDMLKSHQTSQTWSFFASKLWHFFTSQHTAS